MKILRLALVALISCLFTTANAQSFSALENRRGDNSFEENGLELYLRRTQVSSEFNPSYGGFTFNIKFRSETYEKGGNRYHFENPTLGDMLFVVGRMIRTGNGDFLDGDGQQSFGSGFFGWHHTYWNVVATDRLLVSPGLSLGDYIFTTRRPSSHPNNGGKTLDPGGYFFHAGPAMMVSTVVGDRFWLNFDTRYDLTARAGKPSGDYVAGYKKPHFFGLGASIQHAGTRLCGGVNYTTLIDRGPNGDKANRIDISFGYMF